MAELQTKTEAQSGEHSKEWKQAADSEYTWLLQNETSDLILLPTERKFIRSKWVFRVKYRANGEVDCFKVRLDTGGYAQKSSIDCDKTFSPVVKYQSIRTLLAFAAQNEMLFIKRTWWPHSSKKHLHTSMLSKGYSTCHPEVQKVWEQWGTWLFWRWLCRWYRWSTLNYWEIVAHERRPY